MQTLSQRVWEQLVSPFGCIWRAGLGQLSVELLACISVLLGCSLLFALALSILVSCLSLLTWKLVTPLFVVTTIHFPQANIHIVVWLEMKYQGVIWCN